MSEVRLVIREAERDWSGTIHGSDADRAIAALSADPTTFDELQIAMTRFAKPWSTFGLLSNLSRGSNDEPYDAGLVVIDLVARLIVIESTYSSPGHYGAVYYHSGDQCSDISLQFHLADDWRFLSAMESWRSVGDRVRKERAGKPVLDVRSIFYGRPLCEFIARKCFAEFVSQRERESALSGWTDGKSRSSAGLVEDRQRTSTAQTEEMGPGNSFYDALKQIHIDWMMTPRDDLGAASPREIALERRGHIDWDLQDRWLQWTALGFCPKVLDESSHAFRYAGFGTHELVMYYDMIREMLWSCWEKLIALSQSPEPSQRPESMQAGDFLTSEIPRLENVRDAWLDSPNSETRGSTPRSIIHRERLRMPEVISGHEAMIDDDCPLCQMMGDSTSPGLCGYDGSSMDDDFAFNMSFRTREEWVADQKKSDEFNKRFNAEWKERERLGVTSKTPMDDGSNAEWSKMFVVGDAKDVPLGIRVFEIGCRLAELIVALRGSFDRESTPRKIQSQIDQLNRDFGNLREVLQTENTSLAETLLVPVLARFGETINEIVTERPELDEKCVSIREGLDMFFAPPAEKPSWDTDDDEFPY